MNIFATSADPVDCAISLDDKRVVKMCLETAQLMCTSLRALGIDFGYKSTHAKHPCNLWLLESYSNFDWLYQHGLALCSEYSYRYNKTHKSLDVIQQSFRLRKPDDLGLTEFKNCTIYKQLPVFEAYKKALSTKWQLDVKPPKWTKRHAPCWYQ